MKFFRIILPALFLTSGISKTFAEEVTIPLEEKVARTRLQAKLLHEMIHGSLQVMHRDFFRDGESKLAVPSESLEDVFHEFKTTWKIEIHWLAVNAKAMNPDHRPDNAFERSAVKAIAKGAEMYESSDKETYQYAGLIPLGNQCLKCHAPDRTSLEDRMAAVVITIPLMLKQISEKEATE